VNAIEAAGLRKAFETPHAERRTVRGALFGMFRPLPRERLQVLDGVSLEVRQGEALGIMGRNGCGKSTLLKILSGIYSADAGEVRVATHLTPVLELGVGWHPELDAVDNILLIGTVMGLSLAEARAAVEPVLDFAELSRFANLELKHYSSGMAARLAYAVAFLSVRETLILDEIFAVGDAGFRSRCEAHFRKLRAAGHTVVLVSHNAAYVDHFCDRALLLEGGKVLEEGAAPEVARAYLELTQGGAAGSAD
jgi:ABC-type polysaccharide/polyol phosphate transport system ATPase subunit